MRDKGYETRNETKRVGEGETKRRIVHFFHHTPHTTTLANKVYLSITNSTRRGKALYSEHSFWNKTRRRVKREGIDHNRIEIVSYWLRRSRVTNVQRGKPNQTSNI